MWEITLMKFQKKNTKGPFIINCTLDIRTFVQSEIGTNLVYNSTMDNRNVALL